MTTMSKLQNGTDIRGIALKNNLNLPINLSEDSVKKIAIGLINWLSKSQIHTASNVTVAIGMDSRISGPNLKQWVLEVLCSHEITVIDVGLATTPAMFMTTVFDDYQADAAIMITASHLPYFHNGFKFFTKDGGLEKEDISYILSNCDTTTLPLKKGEILYKDLISDYSNHLVSTIQKATNHLTPLQGFHIIVDAGNGAGGFFAEKVLGQLGADTTGSQFLDPNGFFPNHIPNPENKEAMHSLSHAVKNHNADLGIIFDTDVDRAGIVLQDGSEINRNHFIALLSSIVLQEHPNSVIVTDSVTSSGLENFIHSQGGIHHRFKRGYRNVINEGIRINQETSTECYLAIETSGHGAMKENYFLDDGAYLICKILIYLYKWRTNGIQLQEVFSSLQEPAEEQEYRIPISKNNFKEYADTVLSDLEEYFSDYEGYLIAPKNYEGVKILTPHGWFLLRASLHEPLLVLNIESNLIGGMKHDLEIVCKFLSNYQHLDQNVLK